MSPTEGLNSFWEEWLSRNPDRRPVLEKARAIARQIDFPEKWTTREKQEMWPQLTYDRRFPENPVREVWIRGEAFFRVASKKSGGRKVPFVVHTHELDVQVLGTAFNVANRRGRVDIALEHGSVVVAA